MKTLIRNFLRDEDGATAIEYGLIAATMAVLIVAAFGAFGDGLTDIMEGLETRLGAGATALEELD